MIEKIKGILNKDLHQRMILGIGLILWTFIMWDGIVNHPNSESSFGISYMTLFLIPTMILVLQIIRNNKILWGLIFGLFSAYILISLIMGISDAVIRSGNHVKAIDWNLKDLILVFLLFIVLGIVDWIIFQLKPKRLI